MHKPFRFGVQSSGLMSERSWMAQARRIEELGYATLLMPDRPSMGGFALFPALTMAVAVTTTLHVGSYVFSNDYHHPLLLAKAVATLDAFSGGRFELGLGAGVGGGEYEQMGLTFENAGTRVSRLEEALALIKQYFTAEEVNFSGKYYTVTGIKALPMAVRQPHPPILMGTAGKRMLTIAAREADIIAPAMRMGLQGVDPTDVPMEEKIDWIREAAGERFSHIELAQPAYEISLSDNSAPVFSPSGMRMPMRTMTTDQAIEHLLAHRERYGFSYIHIFDGQLENFAPVVARLNGK
ncbi:TIGR03621 family F420-dependent LLM class oxidoreductase [Tengunoibacter tsumagoiensis]|uniref:LLM class F420-dependent oxidoreductase n=1 Tax=Tengunoibacter tsumagoiensis TaxID=2014871 RepID=A0A401ZYM4_9CHLR|nr:TIGR03621 family F420-dependent LLM class oxidoreductase [Tengunoibacter tsumagoiensis]GCE11933.1 LLM class F420-dependent oxidoreductase [Tengunoibacter tsumagoiensis]